MTSMTSTLAGFCATAVVAVIDSIRAAAGNDLISVRGEISTEDGEHVATTYSTIVARGTAAEGE